MAKPNFTISMRKERISTKRLVIHLEIKFKDAQCLSALKTHNKKKNP